MRWGSGVVRVPSPTQMETLVLREGKKGADCAKGKTPQKREEMGGGGGGERETNSGAERK